MPDAGTAFDGSVWVTGGSAIGLGKQFVVLGQSVAYFQQYYTSLAFNSHDLDPLLLWGKHGLRGVLT
jgi:hypothetical protein